MKHLHFPKLYVLFETVVLYKECFLEEAMRHAEPALLLNYIDILQSIKS